MLNEFRSQKIIWDKANNNVYEKIEAHAGDTNGRKLVVQVINAGVVEDITGFNLSLAWSSRSGNHGLDAFTDVDLEKGLFELYYTTEMLTNAGSLDASLVLVDKNGRIESKSFKIVVNKSNVDDDAVQSENSFTALTEALVKVSQYQAEIDELESNYAPQLQAVLEQFNNAIANLTEDSEVITARTSLATGIDYDSLALILQAIEKRQVIADIDNNKKYVTYLEVFKGKPRLKVEEVI